MREYKKVSMDKVWTEDDKIIIEFGKEYEKNTGKDFYFDLSLFLWKKQYDNSFYQDENGQIFPMRTFTSSNE